MSQINGDKSRYQINRKRKLKQRERTRALVAAVKKPAEQSEQPAKKK
jgi:hypothetical protein